MFYNNLKKICEEQGLKMTPVVVECGGQRGSISNWKNGAVPNSDIVMKLAVRLNVSTDILLFGEQLVVKDENILNMEEKLLINNFKKLSEAKKNQVIGYTKALLDINEVDT